MTPIGGSHRRRRPGRVRSFAAVAMLAGVISGAGASAGEGVVTLAGNHPVASLAGFVPAAGDKTLDLQVIFALRNRGALDRLLAEQQDSRSPRYHHWLTSNQFAAQFGPSAADFNAVGAWLKSQNFRVVSADIRNRYIRFSATVSDVQRTFGGAIVASGDGRLYANTADPVIPARFANVVARIEGLENLRAVTPMIRRFGAQSRLEFAASDGAPPDASAAASNDSPAGDPEMTSPEITSPVMASPEIMLGKQGPLFGPSDFYTFYDQTPPTSPGNNGSGYTCIAVIEDSNYLDSAVASFSSELGLSAASVSRVFADSTDPGITSDEVEALLDIEWAHAVAPGAPISVYIGNGGNSSPNGPILDAIQRAVSDKTCAAISVSFDMCGPGASFYQGTVDSIFAQAASQGQSVFISSGDNGAAGAVFDSASNSCVPGSSQNVSELSADPNVTAVGGTQFAPSYDDSGNDTGWVAEAAWNQSGATGGGESAVFAKPAYQNGVTPSDGMRDVPDVAMIAGPPGVLVYVDKKGSPVLQCCYGGTSLAAPIWAATQALVGGFQGNLNYAFYGPGGPPGFRDVTVGNNSFNGVAGFTAQVGYDQTTGFGSVDIADYVAGRQAALLAMTPTPTASSTRPIPSATATPTPSSIATATPTPGATPNPSPTLWMPTASAPTQTPIQDPTPVPVSTPTATGTPLPTFASGGTLSLSAKALNFKTIGTDTVRTASFSIRNSGRGRLNGNVDASALAAPLTITGGQGLFSLAHNQSTTVTVQAAPTQPGQFSGTLTIESGDPRHPFVAVSVSGVAALGKIKVPAAVNFGQVAIGGAATKTVRITNQGPGVLHGTVGGMAAPFSANAGSFTLSQNQSILAVLQFAPTSAQAATAMLSISNDDPPNDVINIPVTGSGK